MPNDVSTKITLKTSLMADLTTSNEDYIIVRSDVLRLIVDNLHPDVILTAQRMIMGKYPKLNELDPGSPCIHIEVKLLRKANKISQAKLAEQANMEQPDISDFEKSGSEFGGFGKDRVVRVIDALKVLSKKSA